MGSQYHPNSLLCSDSALSLKETDVGPGALAILQKRVNHALLVLRAAASESGVLDHDLFSIDGESDPLTGSELAGFRAGARLALQLLGESIA
ncbi:hypothetical protein [Pseudomonas sp. KCJK9000]|uniref:hypothetical protein n=1 Tax=Pseudomonas sp. KCJK9000 TaxID=3344566 RepID=UPI00390675A6